MNKKTILITIVLVIQILSVMNVKAGIFTNYLVLQSDESDWFTEDKALFRVENLLVDQYYILYIVNKTNEGRDNCLFGGFCSGEPTYNKYNKMIFKANTTIEWVEFNRFDYSYNYTIYDEVKIVLNLYNHKHDLIDEYLDSYYLNSDENPPGYVHPLDVLFYGAILLFIIACIWDLIIWLKKYRLSKIRLNENLAKEILNMESLLSEQLDYTGFDLIEFFTEVRKYSDYLESFQEKKEESNEEEIEIDEDEN